MPLSTASMSPGRAGAERDAGEVDRAEHFTRLLVDPHDAVRLVYVGVDPVAHAFQLVQPPLRRAARRDLHRRHDRERLRVTPLQGARSVGHPERFTVVAQPPSFSFVNVLAYNLERLEIVDEGPARLPRELDQFRADPGQPFPEQRGVHGHPRLDLTGGHVDPDARSTRRSDPCSRGGGHRGRGGPACRRPGRAGTSPGSRSRWMGPAPRSPRVP